MVQQYNAKDGEHHPVMLTTPTEMLLKDIMVAMKQTRSELNGIKTLLAELLRDTEAKSNDRSAAAGTHSDSR